MPFPLLIPLIAAGVSAIGNIIGNAQQRSANRRLAQFQADANERYLQQQLSYNSPQAQMSRFQQAGLNPNLIYGQGNPGNQSAPLQYPEIGRTDYQGMLSSVVPAFSQAAMTQSQVQALDAKTQQTYVMTELNKLQAQLIKKNPLMDDEGFKATIQSLKSSAQIKATQSQMVDSQLQVQQASAGHQVNKIFREVELLEQRFKLGTADAAIKAQVVQSKEFQNEILRIQKEFMSSGDFTAGHILQFIQLLILKLF